REFCFFFLDDQPPTELYTLSLHDALPISNAALVEITGRKGDRGGHRRRKEDRKSTRLNSSHGYSSYAVFCLKKKKQEKLVSGLGQTTKETPRQETRINVD